MEDHKEIQDGHEKAAEDIDFSHFDAENRKRRIILLTAALLIGIITVGVLVGTMQSIGSMNAHISGIFGETEKSEKSEKP